MHVNDLRYIQLTIYVHEDHEMISVEAIEALKV